MGRSIHEGIDPGQVTTIGAIRLLEDSKELIATEKQWSRKYLARDSNNVCVHPYSHAAASFCSTGAIYRASLINGDDHTVRGKACQALEDQLDKNLFSGITSFNDAEDVEHKDVIALFEAAKESLEEEYWDKRAIKADIEMTQELIDNVKD